MCPRRRSGRHGGACLLRCCSMFELFDPNAEVRITSGNSLPHWYQPGATYFVTFRTKDSIPDEVSRRWHFERQKWLEQNGVSFSDNDWQNQLAKLPSMKRRQFHLRYSKAFLDYLDEGWGKCLLGQMRFSNIVADSLLHCDVERYVMSDFVVMPNHVHILVGLLGDVDILQLCYSWKKFTAGKINKVLGVTGRFWQEESFDHLVRSPQQFDAIRAYIAANPRNLPTGQYLLWQRQT